MLTLVDVKNKKVKNKNVQSDPSTTYDSNILNFKSQEKLDDERRLKAIEEIRKRAQKLHW